MYNNSYMPQRGFNQQNMYEQIDNQINQLQQMRDQVKNNAMQHVQPTNLTQNFQLAPTNREIIKYAGSMNEVQKEMVIGDTPYFSKDMSVVWIKNTKGEIKTYALSEIIEKDERDLLIESLQMQVNELRKEVQKNVESTNTNDDEPTSNEKSASVQSSRTTKKK